MTKQEAIDLLKTEKEATKKIASTFGSDKLGYLKKKEEAIDIAIEALNKEIEQEEMNKAIAKALLDNAYGKAN